MAMDLNFCGLFYNDDIKAELDDIRTNIKEEEYPCSDQALAYGANAIECTLEFCYNSNQRIKCITNICKQQATQDRGQVKAIEVIYDDETNHTYMYDKHFS